MGRRHGARQQKSTRLRQGRSRRRSNASGPLSPIARETSGGVGGVIPRLLRLYPSSALQVWPSGYYAARPPSAHAKGDERLQILIGASFDASRKTYGSPRVHKDVASEHIGRNRVIRLMRTRTGPGFKLPDYDEAPS